MVIAKLIYLLVLLSLSPKAVTSCADPQIRFGILHQSGSNGYLKHVLHCWLEEAATGDSMTPLIDGGHQVMDHGDDNSTEESLHAQLYLKLNGTIIDPFEISLIEYSYSILDERNISASYYISQYDPFYAEFSCVHNSTTKSSDLVFVYTLIDTGSTVLISVAIVLFLIIILLLTFVCLLLVVLKIVKQTKLFYKRKIFTHRASHRTTHHRSSTAFSSASSSLETTPKTTITRLTSPTALMGQVEGGNILAPVPSHDNVCREMAYKTCSNYDVTLRSPIESPPLEVRFHSISAPQQIEVHHKQYIFPVERQDQDISPQSDEDHGYSSSSHPDSGGVLNDVVHCEITYPKICPNYSEASPELHVKFVDPVETVKFDCNGGSYSDENNEVYLRVPKGAIPKGKIISIQVGVSFHSALVPLLPWEVRPVSPLVKLCVMEEVDFKFLKPVRVTLPHFLDIADEEDAKQMGLQFMKCGHGLYCFHQSDGEASFYPKSNTATLRTTHFCTFCITANQRICSSKVNYRLVKVIPKNRQESMWRVNFCVTYYLKTCLQVLKKQFPDSIFEMRMLRRFKFSASRALEIHFERRLASGWQLALENSGKIFPKDVQYMDLDPEELEMMEEDGAYPPRFMVQICGSHAREPANALICFLGMSDAGDDTTELLLEPVAFAASSGSLSPSYHMCHRSGSEPIISTYPLKEISLRPKSLSGPAHSDLMNFVVAALPTKWRLVGLQLGLSVPRLDEIERNHPDCKHRFSAVFSEWEQQETSPFCWETVVSVLQTPSVEENRVAEEVKTHFMRRRYNTNSISSSSSSTGSTTSDKSSRYFTETRV